MPKTIINKKKCNKKIAVNLLLNNTCQNCLYTSGTKTYCNRPNKKYIFHIPKENTCEDYWQWVDHENTESS